ncbi:MAG: rhodanese-like domain-containing protein [Eubacteriales bacterium]|nr:rhodanese-like domain-containing protein [Eubacteriales bacterium]
MTAYQRTADEMMNDPREKLVIDLRKEREFRLGTCPGSIHIDWEDLESHVAELPKDKPIYLMCYTGVTSDEYAELLQNRGYEVYSIEGGYRGYYRWSILHE